MTPRRAALLGFAPLLLLFVLFFGGGLALTVAQSLGLMLPLPQPGPTLAAYGRLLAPHYARSFALSAGAALASALLSTAAGALLAYGLHQLPSALQRWSLVYKSALILPHMAAAFLILLFWSNSGLVASLGHVLGLVARPEDFPSPLYTGWGLGVILAYVYKETPFAILLAWAALKRLDPRFIQTGRMLGASQTHIFRSIVWPQLKPTAHATFLILFLYAFGAFEIPFLVGESAPGFLPVEVYNLYFKRDLANRPEAMALLTLMFLFAALFIFAYLRAAAKGIRGASGGQGALPRYGSL